MKMPRPLITALILLHLVLLPSKAFPARSWFNPFGIGYGAGPEGDGQELFQTLGDEAGETEPELVDVNEVREQGVREEKKDKKKEPEVQEEEKSRKKNDDNNKKKKKKKEKKEEPVVQEEQQKKDINPGGYSKNYINNNNNFNGGGYGNYYKKEEPVGQVLQGKQNVVNALGAAVGQQQKEVLDVEAGKKLVVGFYDKSCPNAENIVADWLRGVTRTNGYAVANLLRLAFHDCFVGGCDASILLDYMPMGAEVEKSSMFNGVLLKGADLIDDLKGKLEEECPDTVSCADTLAFAANEAMALSGGVRQRPKGGRRDSLISLATMAEDNNLPQPNWSIEQMIDIFKRKGFSPEEMAILLGAHSVGAAHCDIFMDRVYNYKNTQKPDPQLPPPVVEEYKQMCANPGTPQFRNPIVNFDETPFTLDNLFYRNMVEKNKSLLLTDSYLVGDPRTGPTVRQMAADPELFRQRFAEMLVKLTDVNVKTGMDGEVRKTCRSTN